MGVSPLKWRGQSPRYVRLTSENLLGRLIHPLEEYTPLPNNYNTRVSFDNCVNVQWAGVNVHVIGMRDSQVVVGDGAVCGPVVLDTGGTPVSHNCKCGDVSRIPLNILL